MADRTVQEWFCLYPFVVDLADLLDDGFPSLNLLFCDSRREIVRMLG